MRNRVINLKNIFYYLVTLMIIFSVVQNTLIRYSFPEIGDIVKYLYIFTRLVVLVIGLLHFISRKQSLKKILLCIGFMTIFILNYINTRYFMFFDMLFVPIFMSDYFDYNIIVNVYLKVFLISFVIIILMYFLNVFPNTIFKIYRNAEFVYRNSFGFGHPNGLARHVYLIMLLMVLKYENKIRFLDIIAMVGITTWVYYVPQSITITVLSLLTIIYVSYIKIFKDRVNKVMVIRMLKWAAPFLILALMVLSYFVFIKGFYIDKLSSFSSTLGSRYIYATNALKKYGIHYFGTDVELVGKAQVIFDSRYSSGNYSQVDNFLAYFLLTSGIVALVFFIFYYIYLYRCTIKNKNSLMSFVLLLMLINSFSENSIVLFSSAFIYMLPLCKKDNVKTEVQTND